MATSTSTQGEPPPPPPPIQPGRRATRLQDLYAQALDHTLTRLAWDNFCDCYPTISRGAEPILRQARTQMVDKLSDKCRNEFDNILSSRDVVARLNELEELVADAATKKDEEDAPSTPSQLNARLQTAQSQNAQLFEDVKRQRDEIDALVARLEAAVGDVRGANDALGGVVDDLAAEAREGATAVEGARRGRM